MERIFGRHRTGGEGQEAHWLSIADLMSGLMIVFMFIAISLMRSAFQERDQIREIAVAYQENQIAIYSALIKEFKDDLKQWNASIDRNTLAFRFKSPEVLFEVGSAEIRSRFKEILRNFFPRYLEILNSFKESIDEVRIEGHTSSIWNRYVTDAQAYFLNMELSQGRTRSVLQYVYRLPSIRDDRAWVKRRFAAVGFSSSRPILRLDGEEDRARSRRVTFRVITNAEIQIRKILEKSE